jgi:hypothetical protein
MPSIAKERFMSRMVLYIVLAALTFSVGVGTSALHERMTRPAVPRVPTPNIPAEHVIVLTKLVRTYHNGIQASGRAGRFDACFSSFASIDGMQFSSTNIYFDTPKQAERELKKRLRRAQEIISREKLVDEKGQVVGEEVIASYPPERDSSTQWFELLHVRGSDFRAVTSSSLHNITEYKNDLSRE